MSIDEPPKLDGDRLTAIHRLEEVRKLSPKELDELPFGVIKVDKEGTILAYNESEAKLADKNSIEVIGKSFFTQVAPCTNVEGFANRFHKGILRGRLHDTFPYRFPFPKGTVDVMVTLHYDAPDDHAWIFVDAFTEHPR